MESSAVSALDLAASMRPGAEQPTAIPEWHGGRALDRAGVFIALPQRCDLETVLGEAPSGRRAAVSNVRPERATSERVRRFGKTLPGAA